MYVLNRKYLVHRTRAGTSIYRLFRDGIPCIVRFKSFWGIPNLPKNLENSHFWAFLTFFEVFLALTLTYKYFAKRIFDSSVKAHLLMYNATKIEKIHFLTFLCGRVKLWGSFPITKNQLTKYLMGFSEMTIHDQPGSCCDTLYLKKLDEKTGYYVIDWSKMYMF